MYYTPLARRDSFKFSFFLQRSFPVQFSLLVTYSDTYGMDGGVYYIIPNMSPYRY